MKDLGGKLKVLCEQIRVLEPHPGANGAKPAAGVGDPRLTLDLDLDLNLNLDLGLNLNLDLDRAPTASSPRTPRG